MRTRDQATKIKSLEHLLSVLTSHKNNTAHQFVFMKAPDETMLPYRIREISKKLHYDGIPLHLNIVLEYYAYKDLKTMIVRHKHIDIYHEDLSGDITLQQLLDKKGFVFESSVLYLNYKNQLKLMHELIPRLGKMYTGINKYITPLNSFRGASTLDGYSPVKTDGKYSKLVIDSDPNVYDKDKTGIKSSTPCHPYIKCFDITRHVSCIIHVDNLVKYEYDASIKTKLILPDNVRELLDILIDQKEDLMEDIVKGKTGGIIVLATGESGLGKTLTAEVYSEIMKKPLYVVQSSQLGINVDTIETNLEQILQRASRWNAILMIDEADTYIYKRGSDVVQNCIVGVFIRLLEYYRGVLFMTSNRAEIIDDAIISRLTAHIEYEYPDKDDLIKIWKILSKQFDIDITDRAIYDIAKKYANMSGRDVKNTIKMMKLVSNKTGEACSFKMFERILPFMNFGFKFKKSEVQKKS